MTNPTEALAWYEYKKRINDNRKMTNKEILDKFINTYPSIQINDYRPICHQLFTEERQGITIWLKNGDIIEYYPKGGENE